ncbi:MAG: xanthine dehydrogenase family protein subunit M [Candidatus Eremiobacteraeota bacterium]|nr:xanthine dehydrogenase family protein subunit M [Candidatus Eremiobacteraeota bacterium]
MRAFSLEHAEVVSEAIRRKADNLGSRFIAGGTNLVDLMKEDVARPKLVIDITRLDLRQIRERTDGWLALGALATNAETADHPQVRQSYPLLREAILSAASPQLRNMATNGGNLCQRTRCHYFYDTTLPCNKRSPGSGCGALHGCNRQHAILGASRECVAVHPSDMAVALAALEARVEIEGLDGQRWLPMADFHRLPGTTPQRDNNLEPHEMITAIVLPPRGFSEHWSYIKVRDRRSYAFALVSVAAGLAFEGERVAVCRVALGGVAHKPWRLPEAESLVEGHPPSPSRFRQLADRLLAGAELLEHNRFKLELARRAIVRALSEAAARKD